MKIQRKFRHLLISMFIISVLVASSFALFYVGDSGLGRGFTIAILYMITRYVVLYAGVILLLTRLLRFWRQPGSLLYVFVGTANLLMGLLCVVLYFSGEADRAWLHKCLLNLLMGIIMLADAFVLNDGRELNHDDMEQS